MKLVKEVLPAREAPHPLDRVCTCGEGEACYCGVGEDPIVPMWFLFLAGFAVFGLEVLKIWFPS